MIKRILIGIALNATALYGVTYLLDEVTYSGGFAFFVIAGALMGMLNISVKPLMKILSLPLIFLSGGLFLIVINVIILALVKYLLGVIAFRDVALHMEGAGTFLIAGILFGLINWGQHLIIRNK